MAGILLLVLVVCVFGQRPKNDYKGESNDYNDESNKNNVVDIKKIETSINLGNLFED